MANQCKRIFELSRVIMLGCSVLLMACGSPEPVPSEAVKFCLDTGGIPNYRANPIVVEFVCAKPKPPKTDAKR